MSVSAGGKSDAGASVLGLVAEDGVDGGCGEGSET